ncbi:uncharacterized protein LOC125029129 [Penaeus chinensis]|uniref:uncharacterized protein LOC125029129 n=1 Tax=Penaeus chinensis TaxID=139456 RepID=UPI001FB56FE0|nr:uncharacterized protein LOC125029129 [Penaeus chinensis]
MAETMCGCISTLQRSTSRNSRNLVPVFLIIIILSVYLLDPQVAYNQIQSSSRSVMPQLGLHAESQPHDDVHQVFRERRLHLQESCLRLNLQNRFLSLPWRLHLTFRAPGPLSVCVPFKVGSTSWRELNNRLKEQNFPNLHQASAIMVRHPLSRLASAYRDRFLNGQAISDSNESWKQRTGPEAKWNYYWYGYWLPALISSGRVAASSNFEEMLRQNLEVFDFISRHHVVKDDHVEITKENDFSDQDKFVGSYMIVVGRQMGLRDAVSFAYKDMEEQLKTRYGNVSFSFNEFLEFVVWTNDLGVLDSHWTPYTELCVPCKQNYQYILHLETIAQESEVLLQDVGYPKEFRLPAKHRTKEHTNVTYVDDLAYFKNVPKDLIEKILKIYEYDFDVFGYKRNELP